MSLPSFRMPIDCTDSCRQITCNCCSSNVSTSNWERRTVRYDESENELMDEPHPGLLARLLIALCCCKVHEAEKERNEQTCQAINIYLVGNYQVDLNEAANRSRISVGPYQRGEKRLKMRDFQSLKKSAEEIAQRRSGSHTSSSTSSELPVPAENFSTPERRSSRLRRLTGTILRRSEETSV